MIRAAVRTLGELSITVGAVLLLFVVWQLWWTDVEAVQEQQAAVAELRESWRDPVPVAAAGPGPAPTPTVTAVPPAETEPPVPPALAEGESFALVHVPRFGDEYAVPVDEGIGLQRVLNRGVLGHYPGSAMPGEVGNFSVAGHRVTYGRPLHQIAELQPGDPIVVETGEAWYVYRVREHQVVWPDRVDVVAPVPNQPDAEPTERLMTLTACHPKYSAEQRYIVHAVLEQWQPRTAGEPAALAG